jgi:hypothetical protein
MHHLAVSVNDPRAVSFYVNLILLKHARWELFSNCKGENVGEVTLFMVFSVEFRIVFLPLLPEQQ